jgi:hypothetical protein
MERMPPLLPMAGLKLHSQKGKSNKKEENDDGGDIRERSVGVRIKGMSQLDSF